MSWYVFEVVEFESEFISLEEGGGSSKFLPVWHMSWYVFEFEVGFMVEVRGEVWVGRNSKFWPIIMGDM